MTVLVLASVLTASQLLPSQPLPTPPPGGIVGSYECEGEDDRGRYQATLTIEQKAAAYRFTWVMGGGNTYYGVGLPTSSGEVAVAYSDFRTAVGLILYRPRDGGLFGRWVVVGAEHETKTESCRQARARDAV